MPGTQLSQKIQRIMQEAITAGIFPGAILLVARNEHILLHEAFGFATLIPAAEPMTLDTLFDLASLTKVVATTTALMLLHDQQAFHLDDCVADILPEFGQQGKTAVSIRHLLTHSSGLPAWVPFYKTFSPVEPVDRREQFYHLISHLPLTTPPGSRVQYSDPGFIILGALIEILSGMSLDQFCHQQVFHPLNLHSAFYQRIERKASPFSPRRYAATEYCSWRQRLLRGEVHDENAYAMGGVAGHAGLFATTGDLYRFALCLLHSTEASSLFCWKTFSSFVERQHLPPGSTWALGWDTPSMQGSTAGRYFSEQSIGHTGFTGTSLWIDLKRKVIVICLTNRVHPSRHQSDLKQFRPRLHDCIMEELLL